MTRTTTTTIIIGKRTVQVAKKKHKPLDPAEILRRNAEQRAKERENRHHPGNWGLSEETTKGEQGANVVHEAETRTKVARIYRYDAFGILYSRGALGGDGEALLAGVRRFEDTLACSTRHEGTSGTGSGGGRPIPITDRSLQATQTVEAVKALMSPFLHGLLLKLVRPSVELGQPVNNWRKVVQDHTGEHRHTVQASHVRACAAELLDAWQAFDNRERRAA